MRLPLAPSFLVAPPAGRRGEADGFAGRFQGVERGIECVGRAELGEHCQVGFCFARDLGRRDEQLGFAGDRNDRVSEDDGVVGDVAAADVEKPADAVRRGQDDGVLAC